MKRNTFLIILALATTALTIHVGAQGISFDDVQSGLENIKAAGSSPAVLPVPAAPVAAPAALSAPAAAEREWLVLVFINGRNNLARAAVKDVNEMEMVGSTDKVAVTAELGLLQDRGNSSRLYIQKDTTAGANNKLGAIVSPAVQVPGADMGSWKHFAKFAKWSYSRYPAKKVLAILWNHGSGRIDIGGADNTGAELGIAYDDLTRNFIRNKQIALALKEIERSIGKKVSIYASDACLMQMASVAYEIKDNADFIVGSEENIPNDGFPYDTILTALTADPGMEAEALSKILVEKYYDFYNGSGKNATLSAIKSSGLAGFTEVLNAWVKAAAISAHRKKALEAEQSALSFEKGYNGNDTSYKARSKDLADFVDLVGQKADKTSKVYAKGEALKNFIDTKLVIANKVAAADPKYNRSRGLAVYFPKLIYDSSYDENIFSRDSLWDDFLKWKLDPSYKIR
ncbi:MAG: hypothetical protein KKH28_07825 [Elusimicrobia bacterium]|nr:hypothetical protein [Elusimicrobiota bacterium]